MKKSRIPKGFTLIELLIAMTIFAVMGAMAYGGLNSVLDTQQQVRAESLRLRSLQLAMRLMQRDIELSVDRPVRDLLGDPDPSMRSGGDPLLLLTQAGWANPAGQTRSHLQRVGYRFEAGKLYRLTWTTLDGANPGDAIRTQLLDQVQTVEFRFLDEDGEWQTSWPRPAPAGAAAAVPGVPTAAVPGAPAAAIPGGPIPGGPVPSGAVPGAEPAPNAALPRAVELTFTANSWGKIRRVFALPL